MDGIPAYDDQHYLAKAYHEIKLKALLRSEQIKEKFGQRDFETIS